MKEHQRAFYKERKEKKEIIQLKQTTELVLELMFVD